MTPNPPRRKDIIVNTTYNTKHSDCDAVFI